MNQFKKSLKLNTVEENEKLDYFDNNGKKIGAVNREEGIEKGLLLQAVQIWVINPQTKQVLMQQRSINKKVDPGMIDVSAGGHIKQGELPITGLIREGKEEIGKKAFEKLIPTIKKLIQTEIDFSKEGRKGRYIVHEYVGYSTAKIEEYKKQDSEVEKLFFMDYEEVKKLIRNKDKNMRIPYNKNTKKLLELLDREIYSLEKKGGNLNEKESNCR